MQRHSCSSAKHNICGHNFFQHDLTIAGKNSLGQQVTEAKVIDTLYLSMLLDPGKISHRLNKPYKTEIFIENQPAADCVQTRELLLIFTERFNNLPVDLKDSFCNLLSENKYYQAYFQAVGYEQNNTTAHINLLKQYSHLSIEQLISLSEQYPIEIAILCSSFLNVENMTFSQIVLINFPDLPGIQEEILFDFQNIDNYIQTYSQEEFGFSEFREFTDVNNALFTISQRDIVKSAVEGKSLLAVLPTGGGKTFAFQLSGNNTGNR